MDEKKLTPDETKEMESKTTENKELWDSIYSRFKFSDKNIRVRHLPEAWEKYERHYNNDYWHGSSRPEHLGKSSSNDLFELVEVKLPLVTSRPPRPIIKAEPSSELILSMERAIQEAPDQLTKQEAEKDRNEYYRGLSGWTNRLQKQLVKTFKDTKMKQIAKMLYREYEIKGNAIISSEFDAKERKIVNDPREITTIFPDPTKGSIEECMKSWLIEASYKLVSEIKKTYGIEVAAEGDFEADGNFRKYTNLSKLKESVMQALSDNDRKDGYSLVIKMYMADDEEIEYDEKVESESGEYEKDENGNFLTETAKKAKYPNGRMVTIIRNLPERIVKDEPVQYERWPLFGLVNTARIRDFFGTSGGKNIAQHTLDKIMLMANIVANARLTGNPQKEVGPGVEAEITDEPGHIYPVPIMGMIRNLEAPSMPPYIKDHILYIDQDRDKKSGVNDALRANATPGDSGVKTQTILSQAIGRLGPMVDDMTQLYEELYTHWAFIIRNFYDDVIIQKEEDESGQDKYSVFNPKEYEDVEIVVEVDSMSMLPFDVFQEFEEANLLFDKGAVSPEQLIDTAPTLRDKQRAKDYVAKQQETQAIEQQEVQALEQFRQLSEQISEISDEIDDFTQKGGSEEDIPVELEEQEDALFEPIFQIIKQMPMLLQTPEFQALNERLKKAFVSGLALGDPAVKTLKPR